MSTKYRDNLIAAGPLGPQLGPGAPVEPRPYRQPMEASPSRCSETTGYGGVMAAIAVAPRTYQVFRCH
jgi:hypothetical protein